MNICKASEWLLKDPLWNQHDNSVPKEAYLAALVVATTSIPLIILTGVAIKYINKKILLRM